MLTSLRRPSSEQVSCCKGALDKEEARSLDVLDSMERGLARELVADFMEPLPDASSLWKFTIERSENRRQYRLFCGDGEFLLFAMASQDLRKVEIFQYDPREKGKALFELYRPAFTLTCNAGKTDWSLHQEQCDTCRNAPKEVVCSCGGRREILRSQHASALVGDGVNHCMEVTVPAEAGGSGLGFVEERRFVTRLPTWNDKLECLVLDFKGRRVQASAKNFQLVLEGGDAKRVVCQYGKMSPTTFGLDFRYPLTVAQAFGAALTTFCWS